MKTFASKSSAVLNIRWTSLHQNSKQYIELVSGMMNLNFVSLRYSLHPEICYWGRIPAFLQSSPRNSSPFSRDIARWRRRILRKPWLALCLPTSVNQRLVNIIYNMHIPVSVSVCLFENIWFLFHLPPHPYSPDFADYSEHSWRLFKTLLHYHF